MSGNPAKHSITVFKGSTLDRVFTYYAASADGTGRVPVDLTGYTARLQVRKDYAGDTVLDLTTGSGITLGGAAGTIAIHLTAADSANLPVMSGVYDLELYARTAGGESTEDKILYGSFTINQEVTR